MRKLQGILWLGVVGVCLAGCARKQEDNLLDIKLKDITTAQGIYWFPIQLPRKHWGETDYFQVVLVDESDESNPLLMDLRHLKQVKPDEFARVTVLCNPEEIRLILTLCGVTSTQRYEHDLSPFPSVNMRSENSFHQVGETLMTFDAIDKQPAFGNAILVPASGEIPTASSVFNTRHIKLVTRIRSLK